MHLNIVFRDEKLTVKFERYVDNNRVAIALYTNPRKLFAVATANMSELRLFPFEVVIKDYSETEGIASVLMEAGIIEDPNRWTQSGFVRMPICSLTDEAAEYVKSLDIIHED